jgi:hypothetical protein
VGGVGIRLCADGGAELTRLTTDAHGWFEWRDPYAVNVYLDYCSVPGVKVRETEYWPAEAFHRRKLYVPFGIFPDGSASLELGPGECYACGTCEECHRKFPFRVEEINGFPYHVHYLDYWPGPPERNRLP